MSAPDYVLLHRRYRFSASHLYRRPQWDEEENRRHFGKCANLPGHGHNYRLTVGVAGSPDPHTGFVIALGALDEAVQTHVLDRLDHQHLNAALPEFALGSRIPSSENLVLWIRDALLSRLPSSVCLRELSLAEDDDLGAEWRASDSVGNSRF